MTKVTFYDNIRQAKNGVDIELDAIMTSIHIGEWKNQVEKVRSAADKKERDGLKKKLLPYFTGSGTFGVRNKNNLKEHNGRIIIDVDGVDDINEVKSRVGADPFLEYCFTSCSGNGLALVFRIDPGKHDQSFDALAGYLRAEYDIEVDEPVRDVSRARFVSYDPDLIFNPNARVFEVKSGDLLVKIPNGKGIGGGNAYDVERIKHIVDKHISEAVDGQKHYRVLRTAGLMGGFIAGGLINESEGRDWLRECVRKYLNPSAFASHFKTIDDGIEHGKRKPITPEAAAQYDEDHKKHFEGIRNVYAFAFSQNREGRQWGEADVKQVGLTYGVDGDKVREIFKEVFAENADDFGIAEAPEIVKVEKFLEKNFEFYHNEVTGTRELRPRGSSGHLEKINYETVWRFLCRNGFKFPIDKVKALLRSDFVPTYNPFLAYFESLPRWSEADGDHIDKLAGYVNTTHNEFWRLQFKKALVRSIHCALDHYVNRIVIVLVSETQASGKSTFIRFLNPFGRDYYTESPLAPGKDTEFAFAENFIYNLEELSSLTNTDVNRLKAIISKSSIKERRPYATDAESLPRRCTFWGSTNKLEFLTDSHNTRWLCFTVDSINWAYSNEMDIHQVMSQAYALYKTPSFEHELTTDEAEKRDFINKGFEVTDHEKELIALNFRRASKEEPAASFLSNSEIFELLSEVSPAARLKQTFISKSMVQLGFVRDVRKVNGHTVRGFWVHVSKNQNPVRDLESEKPLEIQVGKYKERENSQGKPFEGDNPPF
jgi:hypothetical protein